jgi:hypothetical protein
VASCANTLFAEKAKAIINANTENIEEYFLK